MTKTATIKLDTLVRGAYGFTDRVAEGRVYHVSPWGWVAVWAPDEHYGRQHIMYPGRFEVIGPPRPEKQRTDIPAHLRNR